MLGGHDHLSVYEQIGKVAVIKSGTDFEEFSDITVDIETNEVRRERVIISEKYLPDPEIENHVKFYTDDLNIQLSRVIGHVDVDLDARFKMIRTSETNTANFLADIVLLSDE